MNTSPPPNNQARSKHPQGLFPRPQPGTRRRTALLTEDQYVATSLALVADLSRRVRGETFPRADAASPSKFYGSGFQPS
jgi:hypothetical protein